MNIQRHFLNSMAGAVIVLAIIAIFSSIATAAPITIDPDANPVHNYLCDFPSNGSKPFQFADEIDRIELEASPDGQTWGIDKTAGDCEFEMDFSTWPDSTQFFRSRYVLIDGRASPYTDIIEVKLQRALPPMVNPRLVPAQ